VDERRARQEKARKLMRENGLSAILLMEGTSLNYFAGIRWWGGERLFAVVLPAEGAAFCVCPAFEEGRAREQIAKSPDGDKADVRIWQEDENPYERVAQGLRDRGIAAATIGIEETVRFVFSDNLRKAAASATFVSATPVTAGCRMIKSPHEIQLMRLAAQVTLAAYEATYRALKEGMTQQDAQNLVEAGHPRGVRSFEHQLDRCPCGQRFFGIDEQTIDAQVRDAVPRPIPGHSQLAEFNCAAIASLFHFGPFPLFRSALRWFSIHIISNSSVRSSSPRNAVSRTAGQRRVESPRLSVSIVA
jgi:hypothetical protein